MAKHDLPSMINYVLKVTNQTELFYIGHSQVKLNLAASLKNKIFLIFYFQGNINWFF